jgi:phage terminase large subunit-like protein
MGDVHGFNMVEFRQGFVSMNEPAKLLETIIMKKQLVHFGNPVLRWMASNVNIKEDPTGNIKPIKPGRNHNSQLKIDGIVALIMAIGLSIKNSVLEDESYVNLEDDKFNKLMEDIYG